MKNNYSSQFSAIFNFVRYLLYKIMWKNKVFLKVYSGFWDL